MNGYLIAILLIITGNYLLNAIVELLNLRHDGSELPAEFEGYYSAEHYEQSQRYLRETTRFALVTETITMPITIAFILWGGFNQVDQMARSLHLSLIPTGLIFASILFLLFQLLTLPFSAYRTFVIEEKYGFNRTSLATFLSDIVKSWLLTALIGGTLCALIVWLFDSAGSWAWLFCWGAVVSVQLILTFIAPVVILPLFNTFLPLEEGELKAAIQQYARSQGFTLKGIFTMDASRRSTKSNAFFIGFGKFRRIVLFDTLIGKHTVDELVSILAHEMGHYKKRHVLTSLLISVATTGIMFYLLSLFINNQGLFAAFRMEHTSIYASLIFFAFLYTPINMVLSLGGKALSRRHEFEADAYAVSTYGKPESLISALKKLSVDNLSHLTPHPLKVVMDYSHPPLLERIQAIRRKREVPRRGENDFSPGIPEVLS